MNLGFGLSRSDTCIKCDKINISIKDATMSGDQARLSQLLLEKKHHRKAEKAYELMSPFSRKASTSPNRAKYTFEFQKNLQIPDIPSGDMFYIRMPWVYNFGVDDGSTGNRIIAKQGSAEVY